LEATCLEFKRGTEKNISTRKKGKILGVKNEVDGDDDDDDDVEEEEEEKEEEEEAEDEDEWKVSCYTPAVP